MALIAVTGSTGAIGSQVARQLSEQGIDQRLLVRDASRAPQLSGATVAQTTYSDADAAQAALAGVDTLFMVSAAEAADRLAEHFSFIAAAAAAGVRHLIYTSFFGASPTATFTLARDHYATEERIKAAGMNYTFLRDNFYLDFLPHLVGEDGVLRGPAGEGKVAAVARADVARVAATVAADSAAHRDQTYLLTGPQALTMAEVVAAINAANGTDYTYHNETIEEAYESRRQWPAPDWQYDAWVSTYTAIAAGELDGPTDTVARITGHEPLSLAQILATNNR